MDRIISARAEYTLLCCSIRCERGDHLRSRGVYIQEKLNGLTHLGSSPLARSIRSIDDNLHITKRIISARAEYTLSFVLHLLRLGDHLRSRGVCPSLKLNISAAIGSSPLARSIRKQSAEAQKGLGIISARAEYTNYIEAIATLYEDHLRSRGVYCVRVLRRLCRKGSSPLARSIPLLSRGVRV